MKRHSNLWIVSLLALALLKVSAFAADSGDSYAVTAGAIMHSENTAFTKLPYGDHDISYLLAFEGNDGEDGYWQLGVDYAPSISGIKTTDYVLSPQFNLIWRDRIFIGGIGILDSYISDNSLGNDWSGIYWKLTLGLRIPLGKVDLALQTYYAFDTWGTLKEFKGKDLDYGASLSYKF